MAIRKLIEITAICEGPCGATVAVRSNKVPDGWVVVQVNRTTLAQGESGVICSASYCPKCYEAFTSMLTRAGFSFVDQATGGKAA